VELTELVKLGVPVSKAIPPDFPSGALFRPLEHLTWYTIFDDPQPPRLARVKNQFTNENKGALWDVGDGHFLLVPAEMDSEPGIELEQHWKCYDAVTWFDPDVTVNLEDQFGPEPDVAVESGRYLCNPVQKTVPPNPSEPPPLLPDEHLACYDIFDVFPVEPHFLADQFGPHDTFVENPELLCLPSLKYLPEPGALLVFGPGLMLLAWLDRRKRQRAR
jgi:hypothetical protein